MFRTQIILKHRWLMLLVLAVVSIVFTGCNNGSLGVKTGAICGYVIDDDTNQPISDVLVRGAMSGTENKSTYTTGDGSFAFGDVSKGTWTITVEKANYEVATDSRNLTASINNGETYTMQPIKMVKTGKSSKGTLRGYPIDAITGRAITNFTVTQETPYNERRSKTFDTATDFRDTGWTGLEGGVHDYKITANNYEAFSTTKDNPNGISIGKSVVDLGTIKIQPLTVTISGTFRNVPGYILSETEKSIVVWAESAGKAVASYTLLDANSSKGTITYLLEGVPVTAGSVSVKCKVKGYDVIVINQAVAIPAANPGGVISGVDVDFADKEPILADLKVIVQGNKPSDGKYGTFDPGCVARVYVQSGGNDMVPYADVTSVGFGGEVVISGVITGYPINVIAVNQNYKYNSGSIEGIIIPEGTQMYPVSVVLQSN